jgi:hypothetical protein
MHEVSHAASNYTVCRRLIVVTRIRYIVVVVVVVAAKVMAVV